MNTAILAVTQGGLALAEKLAASLPSSFILAKNGRKTADLLAENWDRFDGFICIMASGIVVRAIAPLLQNKQKDPAVVVTDECGRHAISLLSGHLGGANQLARQVAAILGGTAVITTASDTLGLTSLDLWAEQKKLLPGNKLGLTTASATLVNTGKLTIYSEIAIGENDLPEEFTAVDSPKNADVIIGHHRRYPTEPRGDDEILILHPPSLVVGIGCNRNTPWIEINDALEELFADLNLSTVSIRNLASIDKKNDEAGLLEFATKRGWPLEFFNSGQINTLTNLEISFAALKAVGAIGVAEPAALLSAGSNLLLSRKRKWKNVTMAVAQAHYSL